MGILAFNSDTNRTLKSKPLELGQPVDEYKRLYGERGYNLEYGYLFSELLETRSRQFNWKIAPHTHPGLFQLFFIETGSVNLFESGGKYHLKSPCVILIPPTALHGFHYTNDSTGRILSLADDLLDQVVKDADFLLPMLTNIIRFISMERSYSPDQIKDVFIRLDKELFTSGTGKTVMLRACLQELFIMLFRIWELSENKDTVQDPVILGYFEKFQRLIRQVNGKQTVKALAAEVGITPVHLNRVCNQMTGKSAGQLLNDRLVDESKKYLTYTSYTVSEIAYTLKFEYPNYFARFFKKQTRLSPSEYRKQLHQKN